MGELTDDTVNGLSCSWCGIYFVKEHGYPVLCNDCMKFLAKKKHGKAVREYLGLQAPRFKEC